jgi:hypothetical protein
MDSPSTPPVSAVNFSSPPPHLQFQSGHLHSRYTAESLAPRSLSRIFDEVAEAEKAAADFDPENDHVVPSDESANKRHKVMDAEFSHDIFHALVEPVESDDDTEMDDM